ncbi:lymphotactin isoform X1 [Pan paniscus]|nr:lymphotactin isoform X1 [Pan troglodytes]XP_034795835.1 lymphotactin isoform X1 [Pan paniscus]XP_054511439.1 lymphotactin isoform X1 [Pan troglodytes]XP_054511442.1 lymphotactin isoform X1 [Pan troglodytes]XP_054967863.1 lymphotactin isoform X1 [Pan paniscus]
MRPRNETCLVSALILDFLASRTENKFLLFKSWSTEFCYGVGSEVSDKRTCVSLTTQRLPVSRIKTYTITEGSLRAVIFITKRGLKVCADPQATWVRDVVRSMDRKSNTRNNMIQTKPTGTQQSTNTAVTLTG